MEQKLLIKAIDAYAKFCKECTPVYDKDGNMYSGLFYQQPSHSLSTIGRKYVHLRNCNGNIARYNIKTGDITV